MKSMALLLDRPRTGHTLAARLGCGDGEKKTVKPLDLINGGYI